VTESVCVCVCEREGGRERETHVFQEETSLLHANVKDHQSMSIENVWTTGDLWRLILYHKIDLIMHLHIPYARAFGLTLTTPGRFCILSLYYLQSSLSFKSSSPSWQKVENIEIPFFCDQRCHLDLSHGATGMSLSKISYIILNIIKSIVWHD
jgi:hypothetical protein